MAVKSVRRQPSKSTIGKRPSIGQDGYMSEPPTFLSLGPIVLALIISVWSRQVILGLFVGLYAGVIILTGPAPLASLTRLISEHLVPQLANEYNAAVLILLAVIGGFVALMEQSGGGYAFAQRLASTLSSKSRTQIAAWSAGIVIFFSDLGTPLIVGPAFRALFDRMGLSRQKLAYIIDATAAPVAILIPFIGWGVYIMSLLNQQVEHLGLSSSDYALLLSALPYQFYAWLTLAAIPLTAIIGYDFRLMRESDTNAGLRSTSDETTDTAPTNAQQPAQASLIWLPLVVLGATLIWTLAPLGFPFERVTGSQFRAGLSAAYLVATLSLVGLLLFYKTHHFLMSVSIYIKGMGRMTPIAVMLLLAWAMGDILSLLGTDTYVANWIAGTISATHLPILIFVLACLVSFATGSSWGTFALLFPLALPAAVTVDASLALSVAAVLSGGLFGDHASPISETTLLASAGAGVDPIDHFKTQLPYALCNGGLCLLGLWIATGSHWQGVLLGVLSLQLAVLLAARWLWRREAQGGT